MANDLAAYNRIRNNLVTGDLIQWRGDYTFSRLIRKFTGEYENHSSMVVRLRLFPERVFSVEALAGGLHLWPLSDLLAKYKGHASVYPLLPGLSEEADDATRWLLAHLGTGYDIFDCLSNWRVIIGVSPDPADATFLYCSESIFLSFKERKIDTTTGISYGAGIPHLQGIKVAPVPGRPMLDTINIWKYDAVPLI